MTRDTLGRTGTLVLVFGLLSVVGYNGLVILDAKSSVGTEPVITSLQTKVAHIEWGQRKDDADRRIATATERLGLWGAVVGSAGLLMVVAASRMPRRRKRRHHAQR